MLLHSRPVRYKNVERLAAEEYERERVRTLRTRPDLDLSFEPAEEAWPSSSRSSTPSSFASQEDTELKAEAADATFTPCDVGKAAQDLSLYFTNSLLISNVMNFITEFVQK